MKPLAVVVITTLCTGAVTAVSYAGEKADTELSRTAERSIAMIRRSNAGRSIDSIIVYPTRGFPRVIQGSAKPVLRKSIPFARGSVPRDSIERLRTQLVAVARTSKHGLASVANTLLALDALEAPTPEEYHNRIAKLPVTIRVTPTFGGTRREFYVKGKLRAMLFVAERSGAGESTVEETGTDPMEPEPGPHASAAMLTSPIQPPRDLCEWSDGSGWDECATQQDIDDAAATLAALDSDADAEQSDVDVAVSDCQTRYNVDPTVCGETDDSEVEPERVETATGGPSDVSMGNVPLVCPTPDAADLHASAGVKLGCAGEAASFVYAVAAFAASKWECWNILARGTAAVAAEVGVAAAGAIIASGALGLAAGYYINCLYAT